MEGFVAEHPRLLQTYVAKWPPKPVTNPIFLIRCHIIVIGSVFGPRLYGTPHILLPALSPRLVMVGVD